MEMEHQISSLQWDIGRRTDDSNAVSDEDTTEQIDSSHAVSERKSIAVVV
jgi:hypothetical protein